MKPDGSLRVARASRNNSLQLKPIKPIPHFRNITFHDIKGFFTRASQSSQELNEAAYSLPPPDAPLSKHRNSTCLSVETSQSTN